MINTASQDSFPTPIVRNEEIEHLIQLLSWDNTDESIKFAIENLVRIDDEHLNYLIQPTFNKSIWGNAAIVLKKIGSPRINSIIHELMCWLKDINWPGARTVIDLLSTVDKNLLVVAIEKSLNQAIIDADEDWIGGLKKLSLKAELSKADFKNFELYEAMQKNECYG